MRTSSSKIVVAGAVAVMVLLLLGVLDARVQARGAKHKVQVINQANPGEQIDITKFLVRGKTNVFDFYSVYCGPCMSMAPALEDLVRRRSDVVVHKVDINRKDVKGIDWESPVAKPYSLQSIPHFKIYDGSGKCVSEGRPAYQQVVTWVRQSK